MTNYEILLEIEPEIKRFIKKFEAAKKEQKGRGEWDFHSNDFAALKRSALDLKKELTKVTQSGNYKHSKERE
jgi:hypothetical protein